MHWKRAVGISMLGGAMVGLAAATGTKAAGHRVRSIHDPRLDEPLAPPPVTDLLIATHDGGELHAVEVGSGQPVVLLHGVTLQWWVWSAVIRLLSTRYRVIAWDMRGHGRSRAGRDGVTLEACADDLSTLIDHLALRDTIVVGHSMGGMVLGRFSERHADVFHERVSGAVFLATSAAALSVKGIAGGLIAGSDVVARAGSASVRRPWLAMRWRNNDTTAALVRMAFGKHPTAQMVDDVRVMLADVPTETLAQAGGSIAAHDVRSFLPSVKVPTIVVVGTDDRLTPPVHARQIADVIPGAELVVLPGIGHQVMQEQPEAVVAAVDRLASAGRRS